MDPEYIAAGLAWLEAAGDGNPAVRVSPVIPRRYAGRESG